MIAKHKNINKTLLTIAIIIVVAIMILCTILIKRRINMYNQDKVLIGNYEKSVSMAQDDIWNIDIDNIPSDIIVLPDNSYSKDIDTDYNISGDYFTFTSAYDKDYINIFVRNLRNGNLYMLPLENLWACEQMYIISDKMYFAFWTNNMYDPRDELTLQLGLFNLSTQKFSTIISDTDLEEIGTYVYGSFACKDKYMYITCTQIDDVNCIFRVYNVEDKQFPLMETKCKNEDFSFESNGSITYIHAGAVTYEINSGSNIISEIAGNQLLDIVPSPLEK